MEYFFNFNKMAYVKGENRPEGCILCLLREGSSQVENLLVYRDEFMLVTVNLYPYNPGHLLVFPHRHIEDIRDFSPTEGARMEALTSHFLDLLDKTTGASGYNVGYNMGRTAGGSISHLHRHIIPRYPHETGIADLIAGKRVLVEDPRHTAIRLKEALNHFPFSMSTT